MHPTKGNAKSTPLVTGKLSDSPLTFTLPSVPIRRKLLDEEGAIVRVDGSDEDDPDAQRIIRESVDGKALAVDLSFWIMQACTQQALDEVYNEDLGFDDPDASKTAKIVFDRALNYLRHGCVPVGVIDGQAPWQKLGALRARWGAHAGGGGGAFGRCGEVALEVLRALGLPGVEAPGEAEATCAVMDSMGIVDGCVTSDGDSLLFGARTVFKTLRLSHHDQRDLFMERVEAADVGKRLMLGDDVEHVAPALTALALLTGGDYDLTGAKNVGGTKALLVVKALAKGEARRRALAGAAGRDRRDRTLPERLDRFLAAAPDPTIEALDKCTGCARCKHDGCGKCKVKSHVRGCRECGTDAGCRERDGECECPFHARADERWLHKVRERANATDGYDGAFGTPRGGTQLRRGTRRRRWAMLPTSSGSPPRTTGTSLTRFGRCGGGAGRTSRGFRRSWRRTASGNRGARARSCSRCWSSGT